MEENKKPAIVYPVIVEGKYDKIKLSSIFEGRIFTTDGFRVFNDEEKRAFFKKLAEKTKLIIFTDSDGAGKLIRRAFRDAIPQDRLIHLYSPQVKGKEKRKDKPSAEGFLGVEGLEKELLLKLFAPYIGAEGEESGTRGGGVKRIDLYELGYEGKEGSAEKRKALCRKLGLPQDLSTGALLEAMNLLYTREEAIGILKSEP